MTAPNKEQIYDEQISPLMTQIINICQQHGIAMLSSFAIPTPADDGLQCTSILPDETGENPLHHRLALLTLKGQPSVVAVTISGSGSEPKH